MNRDLNNLSGSGSDSIISFFVYFSLICKGTVLVPYCGTVHTYFLRKTFSLAVSMFDIRKKANVFGLLPYQGQILLRNDLKV